MECAPVRAQAWLDAHDLGGLRLEAVVALIERDALRARLVPYGTAAASNEQHADQVNLWLTAAGELAAIDAG